MVQEKKCVVKREQADSHSLQCLYCTNIFFSRSPPAAPDKSISAAQHSFSGQRQKLNNQ